MQTALTAAGKMMGRGEYEDVNREIQSFLASRGERKGDSKEETSSSQQKKLPDILPLLNTLHETYCRMNRYLESGDVDGLKDTVLKSDLKMSVVSETLLETLRHTVQEKKQLETEVSEAQRVIRKMQEEEAMARVKRERVESDLEMCRREVEELRRILKDQKQKGEELIEEAQRARSEAAMARMRVEELESLKSRAAERISMHEKEVGMLSKVLKEKDEEIRRLVKEKREEEGKNSGAKMRVIELERSIEVLNKKAEAKERNLALCNSELSKILSESKAVKHEFEKHKESCQNYEKLYKKLDKQNAYLTCQLNRLLQNKGYTKEDSEREDKYMKKIKKGKAKIRRLTDEVDKLKNELREVQESTIIDESESLIKRIDELTRKNHEYRQKIQSLEEEKRKIQKQIEEKKREEQRKEITSSNKLEYTPKTNYTQYKEEKKPDIPSEIFTYRPLKPPSLDYIYSIKEKETNDNHPPTNYERQKPSAMFNLEHSYGDKPEIVLGEFPDGAEEIKKAPTTLFSQSEVKETYKQMPTEKAGDGSVDSMKTYHTTSSLKDMMARTDNLQKKFEALEEQLAGIKEEDTAERLSEKMRTYSNNLSTWNIDTEDSDII